MITDLSDALASTPTDCTSIIPRMLNLPLRSLSARCRCIGQENMLFFRERGNAVIGHIGRRVPHPSYVLRLRLICLGAISLAAIGETPTSSNSLFKLTGVKISALTWVSVRTVSLCSCLIFFTSILVESLSAKALKSAVNRTL